MERGKRGHLAGIVVIGTILALLHPLPQEALASAAQKRLLVIYSYDHGLPAHELTDKAIRTAVKANPTFAIQIFSEFLDLSRFGGPQHKENLGRFLGDKYASTRPDLIVADMYNGVDFIVKHGGPAFSGIPIVVCSMFESEAGELERRGLRQGVTGGILKEDLGGLLPLVRTLKPGTRRIALVGGAAETDKYYYAVVRNALKQQASDLEVIELAELAMPQLLERVGSLPPDSIVLYISVFADGAGRQFVPRETLSMVSRGANVPVFGLFDSYLGYGIVGGYQISFEAQGRKAAELAFRILAGAEPNLSKVGEALQGIVRDDKRAAEVICRVRAILKKQGPRYSTLDMNNVIKEYLDLILGNSIMRGLSIVKELAPGLPAVRGDGVQLQQVLLNLTLNAAAAMSQVMLDFPRLVIRTEIREDQGVKVSVSDFGVGIG